MTFAEPQNVFSNNKNNRIKSIETQMTNICCIFKLILLLHSLLRCYNEKQSYFHCWKKHNKNKKVYFYAFNGKYIYVVNVLKLSL